MSSLSMDQQVQVEIGSMKPEKVVKLKLDYCRAESISGLSDNLTALEELSMVSVGLKSLQGLPNLPTLLKLDLSNNEIEGGLEHLLGCPNLLKLNLRGNPIKELSALEPLKQLQKLKFLELIMSDISHAVHYRCKVLEMLPQIQYLDGYSRRCVSCDDTEEAVDYAEDDDSESYVSSSDTSEEAGENDYEEPAEEKNGVQGVEEKENNDSSESNEGNRRGMKRKHEEEEKSDM